MMPIGFSSRPFINLFSTKKSKNVMTPSFFEPIFCEVLEDESEEV